MTTYNDLSNDGKRVARAITEFNGDDPATVETQSYAVGLAQHLMDRLEPTRVIVTVPGSTETSSYAAASIGVRDGVLCVMEQDGGAVAVHAPGHWLSAAVVGSQR